jgi:hypothetical protein
VFANVSSKTEEYAETHVVHGFALPCSTNAP